MGYICAVKNCGHNTARDKGKYRFFRFPAIIVNQGEEIRELSERRRRQWFAHILITGRNSTIRKLKTLEFVAVILFLVSK